MSREQDNHTAAIELESVRFSYEDPNPAAATDKATQAAEPPAAKNGPRACAPSAAIDGASLRIERGEFVSVIGANGSGKSTLAKLMGALFAPDEGEVYIEGVPVCRADAHGLFELRRQVGLVFQNPDDQLVSTIVEQDVAFGPENFGIPQPELRKRVTEALGAVGLAGFERREVDALSGGQKQLVALAGALALKPKTLVLDEATSMLDAAGRAKLMDVCRALNQQGVTVIAITHFMDEAAQAQRTIVLNRGRVALDGAPAEVLRRTDELARLGLLPPEPCALALELARRGIPVAPTIDEDELEEELCRLLLNA